MRTAIHSTLMRWRHSKRDVWRPSCLRTRLIPDERCPRFIVLLYIIIIILYYIVLDSFCMWLCTMSVKYLMFVFCVCVIQMGVSKGHVKVDDVKKKAEQVVAALNLPIQVTVTVLLCLLTRARMQLIFYNSVYKCINICNRIISAHFVRVYLSGQCQPTTVWSSMLMLNAGFACWCHCEISPIWAWQLTINKCLFASYYKFCSCDIMLLFHDTEWTILAVLTFKIAINSLTH